jgi:hypothetical protein
MIFLLLLFCTTVGAAQLPVTAPRAPVVGCLTNDEPGPARLPTRQATAPPYHPIPTMTGPTVVIQPSAGACSGRFHVAIVVARVFPVVGAEFIALGRQEQVIPDMSLAAESYPDGRLPYLSDRMVQFTTPANLPVRELILLNPQDELNTLTEVRVRLPPALNPDAVALMQLETTCVQRRDGCQGLQ